MHLVCILSKVGLLRLTSAYRDRQCKRSSLLGLYLEICQEGTTGLSSCLVLVLCQCSRRRICKFGDQTKTQNGAGHRKETLRKNIYQITCNIFDLDIKVLKRTIKTAHRINTQMTHNGVKYLTYDKYI